MNKPIRLSDLQSAYPTVNIGQAVNVLPAYNAVYVTNQKAGCSTIKQFLYRCHSHYESDDPDSIHRDTILPKNADIGWSRVMELLSGAAYRFTFVRNPATRLISAYRDKIIGRHRHLYAPDVLEVLGIGSVSDRNVTLPEFLDFVEAQDPATMDPHWRPQHINILYDAIEYDFIGHLESLEADMQVVRPPRTSRTSISVG